MREQWSRIYPTVYRWETGRKAGLSPQDILGGRERREQLLALDVQSLPAQAAGMTWEADDNGIIVRLLSRPGERYYGLGLQLFSFLQNGKRKRLATNADATADTGESHAPVPFFVSSEGYGILIDTARPFTVDFGCAERIRHADVCRAENGRPSFGAGERESEQDGGPGDTTEQLYEERQRGREVTVFVPGVSSLAVFCFAAGSVKNAVRQYNLFSGGGCLPPLWGLGSLYRCHTAAGQEDVERLISQFDRENMPFSMIGLEPGWQSHSYSCSFLWNREKFPDPEGLIRRAGENGMKVNLWEQAFVHPTAPFYEQIREHSGDYEVWGGAAPDFAKSRARELYSGHQETLFSQGIAAVKLDECDGSDYTGGWFFPEYARFPSGLSGGEEKNLYGAMAMRAVLDGFTRLGKRTWSQVRANYSYGAPMPFVLYSDLYDHRQFVRALCNAGLAGLLWTPEVRQCVSAQELMRRMQTAVFSPLMLVNAWMIPNPPWKQYDIDKNKKGELLENAFLSDEVRKLLCLRNRLAPYLYTAFYRYWKEGTPPFRPLVMDFPEEEAVWQTDDCYMMGDSLLVAPVIAGEDREERTVYLPGGSWYDFWTGSRLTGGREYHLKTENIPVFVKENSIVPLAVETQAPSADRIFHLELQVYGERPEPFLLVEDDGESLDFQNGAQKCFYIQKKDGIWEIPESRRYVISGSVERA